MSCQGDPVSLSRIGDETLNGPPSDSEKVIKARVLLEKGLVAPSLMFYTRSYELAQATQTILDALATHEKKSTLDNTMGIQGALIARLVHQYRKHPVEIAAVFDETIDPSGNALGWLRNLANTLPSDLE